ncbi:hypothetical protein Pcinc_038704 [Petrolisthes cinctipes]|uniref:Sodium/calcium exchanger membrane region domain-containing protein n=1 Tax=Petrolisthes cinctipes TaxID=88211 RepID=A0AAE1BTT8_PETCI|nr:hypothetical protein Pcinc_038704 [Petrolisthes cinctipes]
MPVADNMEPSIYYFTIRKYVDIQIIEEDSYEKDVLFYLDIGEPVASGGFEFASKDSEMTEDEKIALLGKPKLGNATRSQIRIKENKEYRNMVDKLVKKANASMLVGSSSWKEQFIEAITVQAGEEGDDDEEEEGGEEKLPSCRDYVMHFVTVFWKVLFAFVPPTEYLQGWLAFTVSILLIGLVTAFIGDVASQLGCTIALKDSVTAITIVALGTSIPDYVYGYATFVISILGIGLLTAFIGDFASHFGCTIGLKDSITAIAFVALGTSVPDLLMGYPTFLISILGIGLVTALIGDMASHVGCTIGLKDTITAIGFVALGTSVPALGGGYICFVVAIIWVGILTALIGDVANHMGCTIYLKDSVTATTIVALGTSMPVHACSPQTDRQGGWSCFVVSIAGIGFLTALIGDMASQFGCTINLKDSVTAISIVALGTSVPDTFASMVAAQQDPYADASIGNVTGSNAVNVFLGIGIAWTMAAIYHYAKDEKFLVKPGNLAFSVTLFCAEAIVAIAVMMIRRHPKIGGELGGPRIAKKITTSFLVFLWIFYVLMSTLEAYGYVPSLGKEEH